MKDKIVYKTSAECTVYAWTVESFNEVTGNKCKAFRRNMHTAPDFIGDKG